jgi:hypothetical protein
VLARWGGVILDSTRGWVFFLRRLDWIPPRADLIWTVFFFVFRIAGEPDGGEAEAIEARDPPRAVVVESARFDPVPSLRNVSNRYL